MVFKKTKKLIKRNPLLRVIFFPAMALNRFFYKKKQETLEQIYGNLCELLVEDVVINVKEFQGIFTIGYRSHLFKRLIFEKCYEPQLANLCLRFLDSDRDVIDIGANVGFFTVLFAKNLNEKKVLSIEPMENAL